ncbi:MAG: hypothetical protein M3Z46_13915 [Actinomycetota bacterium]|nr:hypothetical protein [Actinomycetota bacterium]
MTPEESAARSAAAISGLASRFMLDPTTYTAATELGFQGMDFYACGRGGPLGDVNADVISAAFVFFNPEAIRAAWGNGGAVMAPLDAAQHWADAAHTWAEAHIPDDIDSSRLAELAGKMCGAADPAGAPLFAAWRALPEPADDRVKALALHRLNGLRELRNAMHGAGVLAAGLTPVQALMIRHPQMAPLFGWQDPAPAVEAHQAAWDVAEAATNRAFSRVFAALDEPERADFVRLANALDAATSAP